MIYSSTYSTKMENNCEKKSKSKIDKSEKINVKLNKSIVDENSKG